MKSGGKQFLEVRARIGRTATYDEFWDAADRAVVGAAGNPWRQVPQLLRHVGEDSIKEITFVLGALVVGNDADSGPSEGFFRLAVREGLLEDKDFPALGTKWTGMTSRQRAFWLEQVDGLFKFYQSPTAT